LKIKLIMLQSLYEYLFFTIYMEFKKIYSEQSDPVFYSIMAVLTLLIILSSPIIYFLSEHYLNLKITKGLWIVGVMLVFGLNYYYFSNDRIKKIESKFEDETIRKKFKLILSIVLILLIIQFLIIYKQISVWFKAIWFR